MAGPADAVTRRWVEFVALYLGAPLLIALWPSPRMMFPALLAFCGLGLLMLWQSGFQWSRLWQGWGRIRWARVALFAAIVAGVAVTVLWWRHPSALFAFPRSHPGRLAMVWMLYPVLSALPQELIFRVLFFHRYQGLFRGNRAAVLVNAAVFALAHLMYWSPVVLAMTFAGGLVFALVYLRRGFVAAWVFHAVAGNVLFTVGMGIYFYSGNVTRPF